MGDFLIASGKDRRQIVQVAPGPTAASLAYKADRIQVESDFERIKSVNALGQLIQNMRIRRDLDSVVANPSLLSSFYRRDGYFADVYTDTAGISASKSQYYDVDVRKVIGTQRAFKDLPGTSEENFDDLSDWSVNVGVTTVDPGDPDPMVGLVAEMNTGPSAGSVSVLQKYYAAIPATFGVTVQMGYATSNGPGEELEMQVQNNQGHQLKVRVFNNTIQIFYNGVWNTRFVSGAWVAGVLTEWWIDVVHNGGSSYSGRLFAGTQELPGFTGNLPGGTPGEDGYVTFIQYSSSVANRKARLGFLQIGTSALPADMNLVSVAQPVESVPSKITMAVMFEDVCAQTVVNTDLKGWISKNGEDGPWHQVQFENYEQVEVGILDPGKPIYLLAGTVDLPAGSGQSVSCRITSDNGRYFVVAGVAWRKDA